jgi:hypothetical protein
LLAATPSSNAFFSSAPFAAASLFAATAAAAPRIRLASAGLDTDTLTPASFDITLSFSALTL